MRPKTVIPAFAFIVICIFESQECILSEGPAGGSDWTLQMPLQRRVDREVTLDDREACQRHKSRPPNMVDTSERVAKLREKMAKAALDGYIVPSEDEHQSPYVAEADKRRKYISGFSGSDGTAVILKDKQALWTDGRYFLQAEDQLDCNWLLMKERQPGVPSIVEWIKESLSAGSRVGSDPKLVSASSWVAYDKDLASANIELVPEENNLVDEIWEDRPPYSSSPVEIHELSYAGEKWEDKVARVREKMKEEGADIYVVSALDEAAWLLNLRGSDIPFNPVFRSYVIINPSHVMLFIHDDKISPAVDNHLHVNQCGEGECIEIMHYSSVVHQLRASAQDDSTKAVMMGSKYSYSGGVSYALYSAVPESKRKMVVSPILEIKARKNSVEFQGMKNAHVRDAVALIELLAQLEEEIPIGKYWDEITASNRLNKLRAEQKDFKSPSFETISAFGSNGAIIHYRPTPASNKQITTESLYLVDSGGQYKDGTTDVTRTVHFGNPTTFQIEAYTRVLKGAINLATAVFPEGTEDTDLDILARLPLYEVGLDYRHGTGHGIGHFLNVHEAPIQVRIYGKEGHVFEAGHFFSDEPGYYQPHEFGIRLETIVAVVPRNTKYHFDKKMLGFEPVTLVPFEPKLINFTMLNDKQCNYLNLYHAQVEQIVGKELQNQGKTKVYGWLMSKVKPLPCKSNGELESLDDSVSAHAVTAGGVRIRFLLLDSALSVVISIAVAAFVLAQL